jgi:hypothetical protein
MKTIALIAAFNEADIIGPVIADLIEQGVAVYLIDHVSTDATRRVAEPFLGRGLLGIEQFPQPGESAGGDGDGFPWRALLRRKETLAQELDADWFIHHDADEFRESPWDGVRLADAIARVDAAGYNAIDFEVVNFIPVNEDLPAGTDPRPHMRYCEPGRSWDKLQVKCWKRTAVRVDLVSSGGHDVRFPDRRVFPLRFLLRHYPIRGQKHGERKIFIERRPRISVAERELGWHIQYDHVVTGHNFLASPGQLEEYDPERMRLDMLIRHRGVEALETTLEVANETLHSIALTTGMTSPNASEQPGAVAEAVRVAITHRDERLTAHDATIAALRDEVSSRTRDLADVHLALERALDENASLKAKLRDEAERRALDQTSIATLEAQVGWLQSTKRNLQARLDAVYDSKTWRWTYPLRRLLSWVAPRQRH